MFAVELTQASAPPIGRIRNYGQNFDARRWIFPAELPKSECVLFKIVSGQNNEKVGATAAFYSEIDYCRVGMSVRALEATVFLHKHARLTKSHSCFHSRDVKLSWFTPPRLLRQYLHGPEFYDSTCTAQNDTCLLYTSPSPRD